MTEILTIEDVAKELLCGTEQVTEEIRLGNLPGVKFGRGWVVPRSALYQRVNELAMERMLERAKQMVHVPLSAPAAPVAQPQTKKPGRARLR